MKRLSVASAFGATSVAVTSRPLARNSAVQLAPMTPVPIMATRRIGFLDMVVVLLDLILDFRVSDPGDIACAYRKLRFSRSVELAE